MTKVYTMTVRKVSLSELPTEVYMSTDDGKVSIAWELPAGAVAGAVADVGDRFDIEITPVPK